MRKSIVAVPQESGTVRWYLFLVLVWLAWNAPLRANASDAFDRHYSVDTAPIALPLKARGNQAENAADVIPIRTTDDLKRAYGRYGLSLSAVVSGRRYPPAVLFEQLPRDLPNIDRVDRYQRDFFATILPAVRSVNAAILKQRRRIERYLHEERNAEPVPDWLADLARHYGSEPNAAALLERVDVIPPSLALAQAALESGWGTSRFARKGNAVFGEHTLNADDGLKPRKRAADDPVHVETFPSLLDSVVSYAMVLNAGAAYSGFRAVRTRQRREKGWLDGAELAGELAAYSERGAAYIADLRETITANRLERLDRPPREPVSQADGPIGRHP